MHTETNMKMPGSVDWFYKEWANVHRLIQDGVPIIGFTWYSLTHQVDWDTALLEDKGHVHEVGLYDLERNLMPVGNAYKRVIQQWQDILSSESYKWSFRH
jgi:beta-glucosidase/6-phospho-beta-glucosidase/beta-galactosidase